MPDNIVVGRDTNRVMLHSVVPLAIPFAIGIAPSDICNFKCIYCNQATERGIVDARIISWNEFLTIATQIQDLIDKAGSRLKIIRFIGNGEPLVNKMLPDMIKYVSDRNMADRYEVTTNGSLLTEEMSDRLIESGLTRLLISVQGVTASKYKEICGYNIDMEKFVEQIRYFFNKSRGRCRVVIKTVNVSVQDENDRRRFYEMFENICDDINVENILETSDGVDFSSFMPESERGKSRYNMEVGERICCDTMFMYMNIHSSGDVDTCGCIYPPLFIGNIYKTPLSRLWNGEKHKEYMIKHLTGRRCEIGVCAKCQSILFQSGFKEDNLDPYLDEVLDRVKKL